MPSIIWISDDKFVPRLAVLRSTNVELTQHVNSKNTFMIYANQHTLFLEPNHSFVHVGHHLGIQLNVIINALSITQVPVKYLYLMHIHKLIRHLSMKLKQKPLVLFLCKCHIEMSPRKASTSFVQSSMPIASCNARNAALKIDSCSQLYLCVVSTSH